MKRAFQYATAAALATLLVSAATAADQPKAQAAPTAKAKKMRTIPAHYTVVVRDSETGDMRAANAEELAEMGLIQAPAPAAAQARTAAPSARMAAPAAAVASESTEVHDLGANGVSVKLSQDYMSQLYAYVGTDGKVSVSHAKTLEQLKQERVAARKSKKTSGEVK
jgi:hypothetical protein